jgi:regulator of replication initiation timing
MERTIRELAAIVRELILEVGDMKERINALESKIIKEDERQIPYPLLLQGESYENLGRIYQQGFHVCPEAYGQPRQADCLFCIAFLQKE